MEMPGSKIRFSSIIHMAFELVTLKVSEPVWATGDGSTARAADCYVGMPHWLAHSLVALCTDDAVAAAMGWSGTGLLLLCCCFGRASLDVHQMLDDS
jgi:hypothetical protein